MVFSSLVFLFLFLPLTLTAYYLAPARWRNATLLLASLVFYSWGAPRFVAVLLVSCCIDHPLGLAIARAGRGAPRRKAMLALGVALNLALLLYFKYANFVMNQVSGLLALLGGAPPSWAAVALPIGISFITFHKISYLVDVYRGAAPPCGSLGRYLLYITFFPQLIAGPIIRFHDIAAQLVARVHSADKFLYGIQRFCLGLGKKVLIANILGEVADCAFALEAGSLSPGCAWLGAVCYAFQIYFDFSGYSDMAIGLARMFGLEFLENFNRPYLAVSFTDFWRRWHISLSNWMREYLYIPLGGSRRGTFRTYANLWIVFVLCGFWHGASWSFLAWGAFHGAFLTLDKIGRSRGWRPLPRPLAIAAMFALVTLSWVPFRAPNLQYAAGYLGSMFLPGGDADAVARFVRAFDARAAWVLTLAALLTFAPAFALPARLRSALAARPAAAFLLSYAGALVLLLLSASALVSGHFNPFIYFQF